jgi:predicted MPP superfamily phosphohydrolase
MNSRTYVIILAIIILFTICFFTARVYSYGLKMNSHETRDTMVVALLMPVLYIGTLIGGPKTYKVNKGVYRAVNVTAGLFFYLFLGAILLGLTSLAFLIGGKNVPIQVSWGIFIVALIAGLASFVQARRIVTKHYTVKLAGAPASWNGKTAVMISDTHFGLVNYTKFADKVVNKILSQKPDFVLHAGDFYDGPNVDTTPITESWKKLTAQVPLFYTPGNHEAYGDYQKFVESVRATGATILDDKLVEYDGVQIAGVLYRTGKENPEVAEVLKNIGLDPSNSSGQAKKATILIHHPPTAFEIPHQHGVNLIVSGHTHQGQTWPLRYITHKVYGKYDYGMHPYKELTSITSDGIGTYGPPMRLFNSPEVVVIHFTA